MLSGMNVFRVILTATDRPDHCSNGFEPAVATTREIPCGRKICFHAGVSLMELK
jgi:hypothetical protein